MRNATPASAQRQPISPPLGSAQDSQAPRSARNLSDAARPGVALRASTFVLTFSLLALVQVLVERPMLLAERFLPGAGWLEAAVLAGYGSWLVGALHHQRSTALWRRRLWTFFSVVFFGQLALGLMGIERFLMSGDLHLPIPAMIVAGPLYRGGGIFMPILFAVTVLLVGPAWCSYLCYVGSWDLNGSLSRRRPVLLPQWRHGIRLGILLGIIAVALGLRRAGVGSGTATLLGLAFGLTGVAVMLAVSRRLGAMVHCAVYCPIGLLADVFGKLAPFRLRIAAGCTDCGACALKCRYAALQPEHIRRRRPGIACTLCGDCLSACRGNHLTYSFLGSSPRTARATFLVLVVSLHAVFLGVARI